LDISEIRKKAKKKKKTKKETEIIKEVSSEIIKEPVKEEKENFSSEEIEKIVNEEKVAPVENEGSGNMDDFLALAGETLLSKAFLDKDIVVDSNIIEFLGIKIDGVDYGLNIENVMEITKILRITKVPLTPDYILGIISLRGKVFTLLSLRKKFNIENIEFNNLSRIIVINGENEEEVAILVDEVTQVYRVPVSNIEPHPVSSQEHSENYVEGIAKGENLFLLILDINKISEVEINDY